MGELSASQARRIALYAQGFGTPRPSGRVDRRHLRRVLRHIGLIQIDSVNVLVRSQELPLFARLGPHPRSLIPDATAAGELFEYWVHEACHVPVEQRPLYGWAMQGHPRWKSMRRFAAERPDVIESVLARVRVEGPLVASDLEMRDRPKGQWWDWDDGKLALEHLFRTGEVAATRRPNDFARLYDLAERVIPAEVLDLPRPSEHDAKKELLVLAAQYHGVGTAADLADYHRLVHTRALLAELVEEGRLVATTVDGWTRPAFMHPDAYLPRWVRGCALLSPFDPVVWFRDRAERLFDFHYRIEIYVPKPQRVFGYYVLPVLLDDRLVARVDVKADRANGRLLVLGAHGEPGIDPATVIEPMSAELRSMAAWLGLGAGVEVSPRGDLAPALRAHTS
ncbi:winged helix-turn-helix domain-containing protein [Ilumatobacter nonamiensis]|uniref:winged helix-turn-helix domain-containing protein n=1 Tax=Ilumatobacter nonamiensis TaxID=467093 RepID=UPI00058FBA7A|nr:crosslink repair DNA glycosylase YcaQ family protein [Ilumatobacter nonamiensis]